MRSLANPWRTAAWIGLAVVTASLLIRLGRHDQFTIDTLLLVRGTHIGLDCVGDGVFKACAFDHATQGSTVGPYPLLQYLPSAVFVGLGFSERNVLNLLAWLNAAAIIAAVVVVARYAFRRRGPAAAALAVFAMVSGMLVTYAGATVGEPLAMLAILVTCRLALARRPTVWLGVASTLAVIGKETLVPVVVLYGAAFVLIASDDRAVARRKGWLIGLGAVAGVVANAALNYFRFGSFRNVAYLEAARRARPGQAARSAISVLASPNGGLAWFWLTAFAALAFLTWAAFRRLTTIRGRAAPPWREPSTIGLGLLLLGFAAGMASLALWWMPFGWYSWGPRLVIPFVPPLFLAVVELCPAPRRSTIVATAGVVVVSFLLIVPNWAYAYAPDSWMTHWLATLGEQPQCGASDLTTVEGFDQHHHCIMRAAWRTSAMPMRSAVDTATDRDPTWYWATVFGAVITGGLVVAGLRRAPPTPASDPTGSARR